MITGTGFGIAFDHGEPRHSAPVLAVVAYALTALAQAGCAMEAVEALPASEVIGLGGG